MNQTTDRQRRVQAVVDEALQREPAARDAYLDRACAGDPALRPEVMHLVAADQDTCSFLEQLTHTAPSAVDGAETFSGTRRFRVLRRLGSGGMGVELQDDEDGRMLRRVADEWMTAQNIRNPAAMTRMLVTGFSEIA